MPRRYMTSREIKKRYGPKVCKLCCGEVNRLSCDTCLKCYTTLQYKRLVARAYRLPAKGRVKGKVIDAFLEGKLIPKNQPTKTPTKTVTILRKSNCE